MEGIADEAESKKLHPFFSGPKIGLKDVVLNAVRPVTPDPSCSPSSDRAPETKDARETTGGEDVEVEEQRRKRRKTDSNTKNEQAKPTRGRPRKILPTVSAKMSIMGHFGQKPDDPTDDSPLATHAAVGEYARGERSEVVDGNELSCPLAQAPTSTLNTVHTPAIDTSAGKPDTISKAPKLLKFNPKTGTIGSPPRPKLIATDKPDDTTSKQTTKPRRNKRPTTLVVRIDYGMDDATKIRVGEQIEAIFSGVRYGLVNGNDVLLQQTVPPLSDVNHPVPPNLGTPKKGTPKENRTPKKSTHPFFSGKPKATAPQKVTAPDDKSKSPVKRLSIFTSTPCSPKHARPAPPKFNAPQFGMKSGGVKVPGANHPAWPCQGMVHVRGDERDVTAPQVDAMQPSHISGRKAKGQQSRITEEESIMTRITVEMGLDGLADELKALNTDDFQPAPFALRTPGRHFESGMKLRRRIDPELRTCNSALVARAHPSVAQAYNSLTTSSSAFDRSQCEVSIWTQKHAPTSAEQVLQSGKEAELLRDWLRKLKVQSVDTGSSEAAASKSKVAPPPKKAKKRKKLDGFIVSSGEEDNELSEISETEADWAPNGNQGSSKKTVIRTGDLKSTKENGRLTNAVLLSGPHGCGKTATVYAIAKELEFEVFEINPGSRRSGKDIMEKIGDMTRNHLVQHRRNGSDEPLPTETEVLSDDELARDLKSGKQGMMTTFFKPKATTQLKKKTKPVKQLDQPKAEKPSKTLVPKSQKQSLILLEEVDILYEEDKQFWATVMSLMVQSKRPFIMTCNDESLVPLQSLLLHGIFRLSIPPVEPAVDLLLLIAANEGHALQRNAVEALYHSKHHDLRASITELNYWCQIGVGDPKGGFGWFYRRWPRGVDVDDQGDKVRVVSSETYQRGMGWYGRDTIIAPSMYRSVEEEILQQAWENWDLDAIDLHSPTYEASPGSDTGRTEMSRRDRLSALDSMDRISESLSAADVYSRGAFSFLNGIPLDSTHPDLPNKSRDDFISGRQLLDAPLLSAYNTTSLQIASTARCLAREYLRSSGLKSSADVQSVDEARAVSRVCGNFIAPSYTVPTITRYDYSLAFDPIAVSDKAASQSSSSLDPSIFDRNMEMLVLDVAPYVRSIVSYDQRLQQDRLLRSKLLSEGGKPKKRMRTTRSAYSALEGGSRASTRREKYFTAALNPYLVQRTGGIEWNVLASEAAKTDGEGDEQDMDSSAKQSSDGEMDTSTN